jgi:hypothetical protein
MKKLLYANILIILLGLAAACTPTPAPQSQTWIDKPLQNMNIPVAPYTIGFHAASLNGITQFEVRVDGVVQDVVTPLTTGSGGNGTTLFYSEYDWLPPGPGSYQIQVRAMNGYSVYGPTAQVDVTVVGEAYVQLEPTEEEPTATPTDEPAEIAVFGAPQYDEMELFYRGTCGPKQLTVEIMTSNPDVYSVVVFFRLRDQASQATTEWSSAAMSPLGDGYFRFMLSIEGDVPGFANFLKSFLQFQFVATDQGGNELGRTDVFSDVSVQSCGAPGISG